MPPTSLYPIAIANGVQACIAFRLTNCCSLNAMVPLYPAPVPPGLDQPLPQKGGTITCPFSEEIQWDAVMHFIQ